MARFCTHMADLMLNTAEDEEAPEAGPLSSSSHQVGKKFREGQALRENWSPAFQS